MSINLIRKNSDTPNIRNIDDARIMRYATYGKSGIIKDYGEEVALSQGASNILHIGTGEIVHQGWQVEIASSGEDITLDNRDSVEYYTIYLEINLLIASNQTARILSMKANNTYPIIDPGDDLTQTPTGTSRVEIAHIMLIPATSIFAITPLLQVMPYYPTYSLEAGYASSDHSKGTIEQRLTDLGFKQGSLVVSGSGYSSLSIPTNSLVKQGQMVRCDLSANIVDSSSGFNLTITTPTQFIPNTTQRITIEIVVDVRIYMEGSGEEIIPTAYVNYNNLHLFKEAYISSVGSISVSRSEINTMLTNMYNMNTGGLMVRVDSFSVKNISIYSGWKLN